MSILLAVGICCAMTALVLVLAFMDQLQIMRFDDIKALDSYSMHISPEDASLAGAQVALTELTGMDGVSEGILFAEIPIVAYTGGGSGKIMRIRALDETGFSFMQDGRSLELYAGSVPSSDTSIPEVLVSWEQLQDFSPDSSSGVRITALARGRTSAAVPRDFSVRPSGLFSSAIPEFNSSVLFMSLDSLLSVIPSTPIKIGLVLDESKVPSYKAAEKIVGLHPSWKVTIWQEQYAALYGAMMLEKGMMTVMIGFLMIVMAFMLLHASRRLLHDKQKELAMLAVIGLGRKKLVAIAMLQAVFVALCGLLAGFILSQVLAAAFPDILSGISALIKNLTGSVPDILTLPLALHVDTLFYAAFSCAVIGVIALFSWRASRKLISQNIMETILHDTF